MRAQGNLTTLKIFTLFILVCLSACSEKTDPERKKYSIYTMARDAREYITQVNDLSGGTVNPIQKGAQTYPKRIWFDLIVKDGYYYRHEKKNHFFLKYTVENNRFVPVDSVSLPEFAYLDNYKWVHPDTLLLISYNRQLSKVKYARVTVKNMKATVGDLPVPLPFGRYNAMSIGFSELKDKQLLVGYTYHTINAAQDYSTSDTVYVSVLSYPGLKPVKTLKDARSTYPGGSNTAQVNTFTDEKGDFYFLACPGIALGNHPDKPTAVYRIKKGENILDSTYFFNISQSPIANHGYGLWDIGNNQAIIRSERRELFTGINDHYKVPHIEFYVLDLEKKTVKKLGMPLDKGTSRTCVLVDNGLVYISLNSDSEGNYIWIYNPKNGSLKKGLKLEGEIDYILRIEKL